MIYSTDVIPLECAVKHHSFIGLQFSLQHDNLFMPHSCLQSNTLTMLMWFFNELTISVTVDNMLPQLHNFIKVFISILPKISTVPIYNQSTISSESIPLASLTWTCFDLRGLMRLTKILRPGLYHLSRVTVTD